MKKNPSLERELPIKRRNILHRHWTEVWNFWSSLGQNYSLKVPVNTVEMPKLSRRQLFSSSTHLSCKLLAVGWKIGTLKQFASFTTGSIQVLPGLLFICIEFTGHRSACYAACFERKQVKLNTPSLWNKTSAKILFLCSGSHLGPIYLAQQSITHTFTNHSFPLTFIPAPRMDFSHAPIT